jgi:predicted acylesterase/phospholipase RssA
MASSQEADSNHTQKKPKKKKITPPVRFDDVLKRETVRLNNSRLKRNVTETAHEDNLIGLAFSGGGIRSATFNLGVLQALAQKGLLSKFDYLSTVSGGGYIGSWLAAFTKRHTDSTKDVWGGNPFSNVERALSPSRYEEDKRNEAPVLHWLRLYSNYLTPHTGLISGDTWAMLGTWMRNSILNQTIFGTIFVGLLVLCQSIVLALINVTEDENGVWMLAAGIIVLGLACICMAVNVAHESWEREILSNWFQRSKITITVMLPFVVACVLLNAGLWERTDLGALSVGWWALAGLAFYLVVWGLVAILGLFRRARHARKDQPVQRKISLPALVVFSPIAGAVGGCLFKAYMLLLRNLGSWTSTDWIVMVFGSGVLMSIMMLVGILHIGLVGRGSMDVVREWWARLGGYLSLMIFGWLLLASTTVFAPLGIRWLLFTLRGKSIIVAVLWVLHNVAGLKAANSPKTSGKTNDPNVKKAVEQESAQETGIGSRIKDALTSPPVLSALAKAAPYVFLIGLILIVSTAVHIGTGLYFHSCCTEVLWHLPSEMDWASVQQLYWFVLNAQPPVQLLVISLIFFAVGGLLSWRVDVNDFSLHHFYRNRLVRCYLGASNPKRRPEPFTGFDPNDDLALCSLDDEYPGPYPILNAALNITGGEELGYATRRAKSFVFTPLYCGYELGSTGEGERRFSRNAGFEASYCKTEQGRSIASAGKLPCDCGITIGTAMAISGAAASPNMGYHTSPATAFFMALFDVRLGWWMGNPRNEKKWARTGPELGFGYLFSELLAQSDQKKSYVYLSDGGHFENLAVYELIRRRCRLIVAGDGDADGDYEFSDLLGLIEKARTDFGVRIEIDFASIKPATGSRECPKNFVIGKIYYDPENRNDVGTLILIKSSMPMRGAAMTNPSDRKLPDDVWRYYEQHKTFPHQTTADQWFNECQFESYRALGEYIGCQASRYISIAIREALEHPRLAWRPEM